MTNLICFFFKHKKFILEERTRSEWDKNDKFIGAVYRSCGICLRCGFEWNDYE